MRDKHLTGQVKEEIEEGICEYEPPASISSDTPNFEYTLTLHKILSTGIAGMLETVAFSGPMLDA